MRAFADGYYDHLRRMYEYFGIESVVLRFIYSLSTTHHNPTHSQNKEKEKETDSSNNARISPYFVHSTNNHKIPPLRPTGRGLIAWILEICYLLVCIIWLTACYSFIAPRTTTTGNCNGNGGGGGGETIREYLERIKLPRCFVNGYLLPLFSVLATCTHDELLAFPAVDIVEYSRRSYGRPHRSIVGGVEQLQRKLAKEGLGAVRYGATVTSVENVGTKVRVSWVERAGLSSDSDSSSPTTSAAPGDGSEGGQSSALFDYVVMAVTPNVVGSIYQPLRKAMSAIPTVKVESVVHTDFSRVQDCSRDLRAQLQTTSSSSSIPSGPVAFSSSSSPSSSPNSSSNSTSTSTSTAPQLVHVCTNPDAAVPVTESIHEQLPSVLVTTYPIAPIDPSKILHRATFTRVLRTPRSRAVVNRIFDERSRGEVGEEGKGWRNGDGNVFLVGGWCWDGLVLLEGCVVSAVRVAECLGVEVPWV